MNLKEEQKSIEFVIEKLEPQHVKEHVRLFATQDYLLKMSSEAQQYYWRRMKEKYGFEHGQT